MFWVLFCVLWFFQVYEGNWLLAAAILIWLGSAIFVDYAIRFIPEDYFYDALSTNSEFFFDAVSEVSDYESASEGSVYKDVHQRCICKKYCEFIMDKFLDDCLDKSGFIRFENIIWISGRLAQPEANVQQLQNSESVTPSESTENAELPQKTESEEQPRQGKGSFKGRLKKLFCCSSCCSGR